MSEEANKNLKNTKSITKKILLKHKFEIFGNSKKICRLDDLSWIVDGEDALSCFGYIVDWRGWGDLVGGLYSGEYGHSAVVVKSCLWFADNEQLNCCRYVFCRCLRWRPFWDCVFVGMWYLKCVLGVSEALEMDSCLVVDCIGCSRVEVREKQKIIDELRLIWYVIGE